MQGATIIFIMSENVNKQVGHGIKVDIAILQAMATSVTKAIMVTLVTKIVINTGNLSDFKHISILSTGYY